MFAELRDELVPLVSAAGAPRRERRRLPRPLPRRRPARSRAELLDAVGYDPEHWRLDPSVHPFARSMAPTDVRLTTRWEEDDLAMAFYSCLHEFGHGLYEAQIDPRSLPDDAGRAGGARRPRVPEPAVGEPRRPLAAVLRVAAAAAAPPAPGRRSRRWTPPALYRAVNQVRLVADPDRGRRDDVQPAHRAALRARARAGRGPAGRRRPAGRLERGDAPAARPRDADASRGRPAGHPLGRRDDRLLPDVHDREPDGRPAVERAGGRRAGHRRADRGAATSRRCASGCADNIHRHGRKFDSRELLRAPRGRSCGSSRSSPTSRASCWTPGCCAPGARSPLVAGRTSVRFVRPAPP